jgi:hypothetical protein
MNTPKTLIIVALSIITSLRTTPVKAEVLNLSGRWKLNIEKSDYGNMPKPDRGFTATIEHSEPDLKWSYTSTDDSGNENTFYEFTTAIDGKQRPYKEGPIIQTQAYTRISPSVIEYVAKSTEGETTGTGTWTISEDRKILIQIANTHDNTGQPLTVIQIFEKQ